ncbi:MAG: DUF1553 domain-containing protein [Verrucomicrobiota bacterium]
MNSRFLPIVAVLFLSCPGRAGATGPERADELWFGQVAPLLDRSCFNCHGGVRQKSGLDLRSLENILKGGERGPAIVPGKPEQSHLYQFVLRGADPHMPLDDRKQLSGAEVEAIRAWISALPATNSPAGSTESQSAWINAYVQQLGALRQPIWTPPAGIPAHNAIDHFLEVDWRKRRIDPNSICDDRVFVRRVYLDLCGRIPSPVERHDFLARPEPDKRAGLVDRLLAGADYPRHMREVFDPVLMGGADERMEEQRRQHGWYDFLEHAFRANYRWDRIIRDIIAARPANSQDRGAVWYLYERKDKYQAMAEAIAPIAFGVQIGCAQCHNHPLVAEVEQRHYWGLVAAFNRSKNVECLDGIGVTESAVGGFVSFANLKKQSQPAELAFLNGAIVSERRPADGEKEIDDPERYEIPPPSGKEKPAQAAQPKFSRRQALADEATRNNPKLAAAFVNRIWAMLLGRGLVQPVDQLDSLHRPSHPDLLNWLAGAFQDHGYDIQWLLREMILSRAYQLDSRPPDKVTPPDSFAVRLEKPLSGEQLCRSFLLATGNAARDGQGAGTDEAKLRRAFRKQFPELFGPEYSATLQQATFLSNSPLVDELLRPQGDNTLARMLAEPGPPEQIRLAFEVVLGRIPEADEFERCAAFLRGQEAEKASKALLWALLTGTEFLMNH